MKERIMENREKAFSRNIGFLTKDEQQKIFNLSIGIAGAGGDGGLLSERLLRFGVGKILLADPEDFEIENVNRQFAANSKNIGINKAVAVGSELQLINPQAKVVVFSDGITEDNVCEFISNADVIVDEIEFTIPRLSVMLAREARRQNKYLFTGANIGWGASIICFAPDGMTFEEFFMYDEKEETIDAKRYAKEIPPYFDATMLEDVLAGKISIPTISSAVGLVASMLSTSLILFIAGKKDPIIAPEFIHFDMLEMRFLGGK